MIIKSNVQKFLLTIISFQTVNYNVPSNNKEGFESEGDDGFGDGDATNENNQDDSEPGLDASIKGMVSNIT